MKKPALTATMLVIALAGCGSSSAPSLSAFKSGFSANKATFRRLGLDLQKAIATAQSKTDAQLATDIGALSGRAKRQAASLAKLNPPSRFRADLHKLVAGFDAVAGDLRRISVAAAKRDAVSARAATVALLSDAARVKAGDSAISSGLHLPPG
jgi:hypothetical protein